MKKKVYVLTVSEFFPKTHIKAGLPTDFINKIADKSKIHTIRDNYSLWKERFEKIDKGEAVLSVRYWSGTPYKSKQIEKFVFDKTDGIGIERVMFKQDLMSCFVKYKILNLHDCKLNLNDGLSFSDFKSWFKGHVLSEEKVIIHFSAFRYCQ